MDNFEQSSQVVFFAKSQNLESVAVYCDAKGETFLRGSGGIPPQKILKN